MFRAGDTVDHVPTGERWVLATDEAGGKVLPCGWPETLADATECTLVESAGHEKREEMLKAWADSIYTNDIRRNTAIFQRSGVKEEGQD